LRTDEVANEAAGGRIRSAGERLVEGNGGGSGDATSKLICEYHAAVVLHHGEDLGDHCS
jgi:hypothetical protein